MVDKNSLIEKSRKLDEAIKVIRSEKDTMNTNYRIAIEKSETLTNESEKDLKKKRQIHFNQILKLFPISPSKKKPDQYIIFSANLHLPISGEYLNLISKPDTATALGNICHFVIHVSKILAIPLLYKIESFGSQSTIYSKTYFVFFLFSASLI